MDSDSTIPAARDAQIGSGDDQVGDGDRRLARRDVVGFVALTDRVGCIELHLDFVVTISTGNVPPGEHKCLCAPGSNRFGEHVCGGETRCRFDYRQGKDVGDRPVTRVPNDDPNLTRP